LSVGSRAILGPGLKETLIFEKRSEKGMSE